MHRPGPSTMDHHVEGLQRILAAVADGVVVVDGSGNVLFANASAETLLGRSPLVGRQFGVPLAPDAGHVPIRILRGKGGHFWAELRTAPVAWNGIEATLASIRDVTERHNLEEQLALAAKVFDASVEGIVITDVVGNILMVNRAFVDVTGYSEAEAKGANPRFLQSGLHRPEFYQAMWGDILEHGYWSGEIWNRRKNGAIFPEWLAISAVYESSGRIGHYIGVFTDLSEQKAAERTADTLMRTDALTGLLNRQRFVDRLQQSIASADDRDESVVCLVVNIRRFRQINDAFGLAVGDRVLFEIGQRLGGLLGDVAIARLGGDQFGVVLDGEDCIESAVNLANQVQESLSTSFAVEGREVSLQVAVGVSIFPQDAADAPALIAAADTALGAGKGRAAGVQFFLNEMNDRAQRWLHLENELRDALVKGLLTVHYQPQVDAATGKVASVEALARWQQADGSWISPAEFIPIAEETGMIHALGALVMREACLTVAAWHRDGLPAVRVAVNVASQQLLADGFVAEVDAILVDTGLQGQHLEIEVTESVMIDDAALALQRFAELTKRGVRVALDDFGTGYSSMSYLNRFPMQVLKVDQSFVRDMITDPRSAAIARTTVALARSLGMQVVAEGVETRAQMAQLRTLGCELLQGYYFARPMPAGEMASLLAGAEHFSGLLPQSDADVRTLLCVDDEPHILSALRRIMRRETYRVLTAESAAEGLQILAENDVQVVVADQRMPGMTGTEFLARVKSMYPDTIRIVLTGYTEFDTIAAAVNQGAIFKFLSKPWDDEQLRAHVREAFRVHEGLRADRPLTRG